MLEGRANAAQGILPPAERGVIAGEVLVNFRNAGVVKQEIPVADHGVPDFQRRLPRENVVLGRDVLPPEVRQVAAEQVG